MKKALAIGLAAAMTVSMSALYTQATRRRSRVAKEDLKIGIIYIGDENDAAADLADQGCQILRKQLWT